MNGHPRKFKLPRRNIKEKMKIFIKNQRTSSIIFFVTFLLIYFYKYIAFMAKWLHYMDYANERESNKENDCRSA